MYLLSTGIIWNIVPDSCVSFSLCCKEHAKMYLLFIGEIFFLYYNGLFAESIFSLPVVIPLRWL